jgi:Type I restriction modification DNA specificity domain
MGLKPSYKQTEVGVIPEEWDVKPLKRISPKQRVGLVINPSTYFDKAGTVPLLIGSNVAENFIDATSAGRITKASNELLSASRLAAGDLVTVRVGEPGVTAVVPPELDGSNCASMMIVRRHSSFDSNWLCAVMNSRLGRRQVEHVQYGTAQKQFNISDAVDFSFAVPPLSEQRAIAGALGDVDALLSALERLIAKKRDLKQAAMQQLFTGQKRLPGFSGEWEVKKIREIAEVKTGPFGSLLHESDYVEDGTPIITVEHLGEFGVLHSNLPLVSESDRQRLRAYSLEVGDIVFSRVGSVDRNALIRSQEHGWLFSGRLLRVRPDTKKTVASFLSYQFHGESFKNSVHSVAVGQTMASLNTEILNNLSVVLPSLSEQTAIAEGYRTWTRRSRRWSGGWPRRARSSRV